MNKKVIGVVLIVVGVALGAWGYDVYDSATSQITRAINGEAPFEAWAGMVGGVICILVGILRIK
ncbi:DUF3185 family protein [Simiduia curdlanivorans]|uniref:DUF3185 family protein n=1 Tax=Simiduia curdlanivorans TaxID=1492769 RepID=A0ABV8V2P0_9GAMM|nr:DUF3185 family protein [Simiduia curdlanivorans]MDN3637651.1 DUF3185 family protein [Simiduia curdlanivorans]